MSKTTSIASRFTAAASALALSLVLFTNTLAVPLQGAAATTYVGAVA